MKQLILFIICVFYSIATFSQYIYSDTTWERWYGVQYYWEALYGINNPIEHYDKGYIFNYLNDDLNSPTLKPIIKKNRYQWLLFVGKKIRFYNKYSCFNIKKL